MANRIFDHRLSLALDRAIDNRDKAKTKIAYYYWKLQVIRLERKIPFQRCAVRK